MDGDGTNESLPATAPQQEMRLPDSDGVVEMMDESETVQQQQRQREARLEDSGRPDGESIGRHQLAPHAPVTMSRREDSQGNQSRRSPYRSPDQSACVPLVHVDARIPEEGSSSFLANDVLHSDARAEPVSAIPTRTTPPSTSAAHTPLSGLPIAPIVPIHSAAPANNQTVTTATATTATTMPATNETGSRANAGASSNANGNRNRDGRGPSPPSSSATPTTPMPLTETNLPITATRFVPMQQVSVDIELAEAPAVVIGGRTAAGAGHEHNDAFDARRKPPSRCTRRRWICFAIIIVVSILSAALSIAWVFRQDNTFLDGSGTLTLPPLPTDDDQNNNNGNSGSDGDGGNGGGDNDGNGGDGNNDDNDDDDSKTWEAADRGPPQEQPLVSAPNTTFWLRECQVFCRNHSLEGIDASRMIALLETEYSATNRDCLCYGYNRTIQDDGDSDNDMNGKKNDICLLTDQRWRKGIVVAKAPVPSDC